MCAGRSMSGTIDARKICISVSLGRSSLAGGGFPFLPCLPAFPPCGGQSPSHLQRYHRPRLDERANAQPSVARLRFPASYSVAGGALAAFNASHCGACPSISSPPGFVLPAVALAPPRNQRTRAVRTSFRRSSVAGAVKRATYALLRKAHTENGSEEFMICQQFVQARSDRVDLLRIVRSSQHRCGVPYQLIIHVRRTA